MHDFEKYKNTLPYPNLLNCPDKKYRLDMLTVYHNESDEKMKQFRSDVEVDLGFDKFPESVRNKIHSLAWEDGHAYGLSEVYCHYDNYIKLAELCLNHNKEKE